MIQAFYGHAERLSAHPFGCRVIQRVLENNNMTELKAPLLEEIINCADKLSQGAISLSKRLILLFKRLISH